MCSFQIRWSPNHGPRRGAEVDTIVLHATGDDSLQGAVEWLCDPASRASAHFVVGKKGEIVKLVPLGRAAFHAGRARLPNGGAAVNRRSIGVELVNRNDGKDPYPPQQRMALGGLLRKLVAAYPIRFLVGHHEIALPRGRKTDPRGLDIAALARDLGLKS